MTDLTTTQRTFAHRRLLRVTSAAYEQGVHVLAAAAARLGRVTAVIGIARGGTALAQALGELLGAPAFDITARHNPTDAVYTHATGEVTWAVDSLAEALAGAQLIGQVLLVDDIYGTGATVDAVRPALAPHLAPTAALCVAVLCRNAGARTGPDLWLWTVDDWVLFPWENPAPAGSPVEDLTPPMWVQPA